MEKILSIAIIQITVKLMLLGPDNVIMLLNVVKLEKTIVFVEQKNKRHALKIPIVRIMYLKQDHAFQTALVMGFLIVLAEKI